MAMYTETFNSSVTKNLQLTTFSVFQKCAQLYPQKDKHWGGELDIIRNQVKTMKKAKILDAGCGTGWHLRAISNLDGGVSSLIGIDFSSAMLDSATEYISDSQASWKAKLIRANIVAIPIEKECCDIVLCLNNTLGNLCGKSFEDSRHLRQRALWELRRVLKSGGILILSVYNAARIEWQKYGNVFVLDPLLSRFETNDFVIRFVDAREKSNGGIPYYSHWFTHEEVKGLLRACGYEVKQMEARGRRIVVVAEKV